jgi:hypothetical protein
MTRPLRPMPLRILLIPLGVVLTAYLGIGLLIGSDVRQVSRTAQSRFAGAPVTALCALATDENVAFDLRNRAVWALGQLGDPAALPVLEPLYTGAECHHDRALCQHELHKAITGCRGAVNVTALIWRRGFAGPV